MNQNQQSNSSFIVTGYFISLVPILFLLIVFTHAGVFISIIKYFKNETLHGFLQITISVVASIYGTHLGDAAAIKRISIIFGNYILI